MHFLPLSVTELRPRMVVAAPERVVELRLATVAAVAAVASAAADDDHGATVFAAAKAACID